MSTPLPLRCDTTRRSGFTLLEVVIALAIFVFGALAIVRIFPPALGVIQNSGDQLVAVNLNRSTLARFAKTPNIVPDGVFDTVAESTTNWRTGPGAVVGTVRRNDSLPANNIQDYDQSALAHFKNITGERHTIPTNGIVLTQNAFVTGSVRIYQEGILEGVTLNGDGTLNFAQARDASTNASYTPNTTAATPVDRVYVSYHWMENGRISSVSDEPLDYSLATPTPKVVQAVRTTPTFSTTRTGSLYLIDGEVTARYRRDSVLTPTTVNSELGRLSFPVASSGSKISLDYKVNDWRWLVQDGVPAIVPETGTGVKPRAVSLAVRPLDDTVGPEYLYALLEDRNPTAPKTRQILTSTSLASTSNLDRKAGRVIFDTDTFVSPTSRVVYRSLDNWTQQLSVAPPSYKLFYGGTPTDVAEPWRDFAQNGNAMGGTDTYIYFKPSEAGKTVLLSYSFEDFSLAPGSRNASNDIKVTGRILSIDRDLINAPAGLPANFGVRVGTGPARVARLRLTDLSGNDLSAPLTAIQEIKGLSIQARTAWLNGDRFTQASTVTYRGASN